MQTLKENFVQFVSFLCFKSFRSPQFCYKRCSSRFHISHGGATCLQKGHFRGLPYNFNERVVFRVTSLQRKGCLLRTTPIDLCRKVLHDLTGKMNICDVESNNNYQNAFSLMLDELYL